MAGRCISGDFYAHSSYRVSGTAAAIGQSIGSIAAVASRKKHSITYEDIIEANNLLNSK